MLREKSNVGHTQPLGTDWKAVKAHALMLESKGHLQAALQHINDAIKQNGQPVDDMVQCVAVSFYVDDNPSLVMVVVHSCNVADFRLIYSAVSTQPGS